MSQAFPLPSVDALPDRDPGFRRAAKDFATVAWGLVARLESPLLALTLHAARRVPGAPVTIWHQRLAPDAVAMEQLATCPTLRAARDALCAAGDALHRRLDRWGWARLEIADLMIVSDGTGIALATRAPLPGEDAAWLLALGRRHDGAIAIRPFAAGGLWALLRVEAESLH